MPKVRWILVLIAVVWWVVGCASDPRIAFPEDGLEPAVESPLAAQRARWTTVSDFPELVAAVESGARFIRASAGVYAFAAPLLLENVTLVGDPAGGTVFDAAGVDWGVPQLLEDCQGDPILPPGEGLLALDGAVTIENVAFVGLAAKHGAWVEEAYVAMAFDAGHACRYPRRNVTIRNSSFLIETIEIGNSPGYSVAMSNFCACDRHCGAQSLNLRFEGNRVVGGLYPMTIGNVRSDATGTSITAYLADNEFAGLYNTFLVVGALGGSAGTVDLSTRGNRFSSTTGWGWSAFITGGMDDFNPAGGRNGRVNWASWGDRFEDNNVGLAIHGGDRRNLEIIGDISGNLTRAWLLDPVFANNALRDIEVFGSSTYDAHFQRWSANQIDDAIWGPGNTVELALLGSRFEDPDRGGFLQVQHHADFTTRWEREPYLGPMLPDYGNRVILCGPVQRFRATNPGLEAYPDAVFFDPRCRPPSMADIRGRF